MKKAPFLILSFIFSVVVGFLLFSDKLNLNTAKAGDSHNVSGWAWSETIGWVSLNCRNQELQTPRCKDSDYGVNIENNGNLTGYAWSENIGWINFAPAGPYPQNPQYSVKTDLKTGALSGWARALAYGSGWDGWISVRGQSPDYGVDIDTYTGGFSGWAWGEDKVGWVHFAGANYKAQTSFHFNHDPTVSNLRTIELDNCFREHPHFRFRWDYSDQDNDPQDSYQVQISDGIDIENNILIDSCEGFYDTCSPVHSIDSFVPDLTPSAFDYNTIYYWRVRVWDNRGGGSEWAQSQFTTPLHEYPEPAFTWTPDRPSEGEFAQFCATAEPGVCQSDVSKCYNNLGQLISCSGADFIWSFPEGTQFSTTTIATSKNPEVKFPEKGWQVVSLNINDGIGSCTSTEDIRISVPLPKWKEVAP